MTEPLMHVVKYEILSIISENGMTYTDVENSTDNIYRHRITAFLDEFTLFIVRNYKNGIARMQSLIVVDIWARELYSKILSNDYTICDEIQNAIECIKSVKMDAKNKDK